MPSPRLIELRGLPSPVPTQYHRRIGLLYGDRAYVEDGLFLKYRIPAGSGIQGFPNTAGCGTNPDLVGVSNNGIDGGDAAAHASGTDVPGFPVVELFEGYFLGLGSGSDDQQERENA